VIRQAVLADIPDILAVAHIAWENTYSEIMKPETRRQFLEEFYTPEALGKALGVRPGGIWVAEEADAVIGFAQVVPMIGKPGVELTRLYVLPEKQRAGVGQALLNHVQAHFSGQPLWALVEKDDVNSVTFFTKNRFDKRRIVSLNLYGEELKFIEFRRGAGK
jgi:ribosomal protein S18 acetylase RimI-like enzyme